MECKRERNISSCGCSYNSCSRKGVCCECIRYHKKNNELPGCLFPPEAERMYDRSVEFFIKVWAEKLGYKLVKG